MRVIAAIQPIAIRALRVLLVFTLVFWCTFRIEMVALADEPAGEAPNADTGDTGGDAGGDAGGGETGGDAGGDTGGGETGGDTGGGDSTGGGGDTGGDTGGGGDAGTGDNASTSTGDAGTGTGTNTGTTTPTNPSDQTATLAKLEVHILNEHPSNPNDPLARQGESVAEVNVQTGGANQIRMPEISASKGSVKFMAVIETSKGKRYDVSDLVEWRVEGDTEVADFTPPGDRKSYTLQAKGKKDGEIDVVCKLKSDVYSRYSLEGSGEVELGYVVSVANQAGDYIEAIQIFDKDNRAINPAQVFKLDLVNGHLSYQFSAHLTIHNPADNTTHELNTSSLAGASEHDLELVNSLRWSTGDPEDVAIDQSTGLLTTSAKVETSVVCSSDKGPSGNTVAATITINTGIDAGVQGAAHPQDTLIVTAPGEIAKNASETPVQDANQASEASNSAAEAAEPINHAYSLGELSGVGWTSVTYNFKGGPGEGGTTSITGEGPNLAALLDNAGIDLQKVKSVTFVNYLGQSKTVAWDSIGGADTGAILAAESVVNAGEDANGELLKNTRFRLLLGEGISYESTLSWVNTIRVNGTGSGGAGGGASADGLRTVIGYVPVAKGQTAYLAAAVVGLYKGEKINYRWEQSEDGGVTWSETIGRTSATSQTATSPDAAQDDKPKSHTHSTLSVPTDDNTIGRMYRVIATAVGSGRVAESEPVTIRENTGFSASLAYDPPQSGQLAFFTTSVTGVDPEDITTYIWEKSTDGGQTWEVIGSAPNAPTFQATLKPIQDKEEAAGEGDAGESQGGPTQDTAGQGSDSADEKEFVASVWIHVCVLATEGRETVSNAVMLTVHAPEDDGKGQAVADATADPTEDPNTPGSDAAVVGTDDKSESAAAVDPNAEQGANSKAAELPNMREVTSIRQETAPRSYSQSTYVGNATPAAQQTPDGDQPAPQPESAPSDSPTDLVINPTITAEIIEQRELVNATMQASQPGARWTTLTTVQPDGRDLKRIFDGNPYAPYVAPVALGMTAAGAVEKLLGFRRKFR